MTEKEEVGGPTVGPASVEAATTSPSVAGSVAGQFKIGSRVRYIPNGDIGQIVGAQGDLGWLINWEPSGGGGVIPFTDSELEPA